MFALILESLGATELLFILAIALIFFGPRKLPQLARSMGKGLAEFRKASDDFKRTWEREVALETDVPDHHVPDHHAILNSTTDETADLATAETTDTSVSTDPQIDPPTELQLEPANPEWVVARDGSPYAAVATVAAASEPEPVPVPAETTQPEPLRKHDYL